MMKGELDVLRVTSLVAGAISEDVGLGDRTTMSIVPADARCRAVILAKEDGVVAGLPLAGFVFECFSSDIVFAGLIEDGADVCPGVELATIEGPARSILTAERTVLNFLQRLSGIATFTRCCVDAVAGTGAVVMDTRKTTPGWRYLEKYAVRMGGGTNHRMGLYDQVLIKENHLMMAGGGPGAIGKAVRATRESCEEGIAIEVEAETLDQAREAAEAGADIIMLDNMDADTMREAVKLIRETPVPDGRPRPQTEASGGIDLENLPEIAALGVDRISIGALTHSAPALDISMEVVQ